MMRDSFYQEIIRKLNGRLDPELFERCATDILRKNHPGLVPVPGGNDAGMDGAVFDEEGPAYPLICTIQEDVIGNLNGSLKSYLRSNGPCRKAILATSKSLTPKRRRNLEERAKDLGFELVQIYSQEAFAILLCENPKWCHELLNLTGRLPVLSIIPNYSRPQIVGQLIGRQTDLNWLETTDGDLLLIGQPGSGKTFLLQEYAKHNSGLFAIDFNTGRIAESVRSQSPKAIIVDDAHTKISLLRELNQLRTQIGAEYKIIASCWPGDKDILIQTLQIPVSSTRDLNLLTRDQIVELVKAAGIKGPNDLIRELVNQAEGRPGLAATLCHLCLKGDIRQIVTGELLFRDIRTTFEPLVGKESTGILAAFSIGGDAGMSMNIVASHFKLDFIKIQQIVTGLAAGGVLYEVDQNYLSVRPPMLRFALIREVFFRGASSIACEELIKGSPNMVETALTLIGACARDTQIPISFLIKIVEQVNSNKVWNAFSYLGSEECEWILENHPDKWPNICESGLFLLPQKIIPLLLNKAIGDNRQLYSSTDHPLRILEDWIKSAEPGSDQTIKSRQILLNSTLLWFSKLNNVSVTTKALCISISPAFSDTENDPGKGMTVTIRSGFLTENELTNIQYFWPKIFDFLKVNTIHDWDPIFRILHTWLNPYVWNAKVPKEHRNLMRVFAIKMATDIIDISSSHPGVNSRIFRLFKQSDIILSLELNEEFDILFPGEDFEHDWKRVEEKQAIYAGKLAERWASQDIKNIVERWVHYENEANIAQLTWPRLSPFIAEKIASLTSDPTAWAYALITAGAQSDLVAPFLSIVASRDETEFANLLKICLKEPRFQFVGVSIGLSAPFLPKELLYLILSILDDKFQNLVLLICLRTQTPEDHILALLSHPNKLISEAAVRGIWQASKNGTIRDSLRNSWIRAVIDCLEDKYEGEEIFRKEPSLAFEWLQKRIRNKANFFQIHGKMLDIALKVVSLDQRKALLDQISDDYWQGEIIKGIVGNESQVYSVLLQNQRLKRFHLEPLAGDPSGDWINKALQALDAGYSIFDVARAVFGNSWSWMGNESSFWDQRAKLFEPLLAHEDQRIRDVGQAGKDLALARKERALTKERRENIYGY
jgi:hypothetical protein